MSDLGLSPTKINTRLLFAGIFLTSLSGLILEIAITRIFSAAIWYHFAFVAVSVALVGLGASGLVVHYRLKKIKENWAANLTIAAAIGIALVIPISLVVMHTLESHVTYLPLFMLLFAIPFFFVGIIISAAFSAFAHVAGRLYASDLIGASLGALGVVLFLVIFGGEGTTLLVGLISSVCAVIFSSITKNKKKILLSIAVVAFASSLLFVNMTSQEKIFSIPTDSKTQKDLPIFLRENPGTHIVKTQWNSFSRIDVVEGPTGNCEPRSLDPIFGQPQCAAEGLVAKIFIDGGAGTNIISWDGNPESRKDLSSWMQYLPFKMIDDPKVLIIGSGGGRDVVAALASGSTDVTAVEINPIIFETVKGYGDKAGNLYSHHYVNANVDEGRSFVSRSTEKYDVIYIPFVDTWASVSSGGLGVSENFLYTVEGFQEYYDHLTDRGKVVAVRWLIDAPRFVSTFTTVLEKNGVSQQDVYKHILIVSSDSTDKDPSVTLAILSKAPFTQEEIAFLSESFYRDGYKPIIIPGQVALEPYSQLLENQITLPEFYEKFPTKAYPVTDDSPYFLSFEKPFPHILEALLYISVMITAIFLVGPYFWLRKKDESASNDKLKAKSIVIYFAALGTGFILIELALLQKLILLLGNPTMTFAILLFTVLLSSGVGSLVSSRLAKNNTKNLTFVIGGITAMGVFYVLVLPTIIYSVIAEPFIQKVLISVGLLIPIGFLMGIPMPTGMRIVKMYKPTFVPWMWAINGAFSVLGAVLSVVIGITYGASYAMIIGIVAYLVALCVSFVWKKRSIEIITKS
ncbi:hypothetical protein [Candidatus Nitrosotenuis uzonensis]|uniref:Spermine synthase n=1 Tax=Candidatus Nitrosotenuis uzonensis TaxID=1407055 RepID=V6ARA1_9ARCH|nr:hypothetical protein [Candidatus Nitrosotenuis uzonensis]CDI04953.1 conserved membrane hypothetical protein [Candidatus Nitrosotenuis uzonensis]